MKSVLEKISNFSSIYIMYPHDRPEMQANQDIIHDIRRELVFLLRAASADDIGGWLNVEDIDERPFVRILVRSMDDTILQIDCSRIFHAGDKKTSTFTIIDHSLDEETGRIAHAEAIPFDKKRIVQYRTLSLNLYPSYNAAEFCEFGYEPHKKKKDEIEKYDIYPRAATYAEMYSYLQRIRTADVLAADDAEEFLKINDKADMYVLTQKFREDLAQERGGRLRGVLSLFRK